MPPNGIGRPERGRNRKGWTPRGARPSSSYAADCARRGVSGSRPPRAEASPRERQAGPDQDAGSGSDEAGDRLSDQPVVLARVHEAHPRPPLAALALRLERLPLPRLAGHAIQLQRALLLWLSAGAGVDRHLHHRFPRRRQACAQDRPVAGLRGCAIEQRPERPERDRCFRCTGPFSMMLTCVRGVSSLSGGPASSFGTPGRSFAGARRAALRRARRGFAGHAVGQVAGPRVSDHRADHTMTASGTRLQ